MDELVHVLIIGGGITGLTLANLLVHGTKAIKFRVTLFESRSANHQDNLGGGIGLWPPSQSVLQSIPGYQSFIDNYGFIMPAPSYRDERGSVLAQASQDFTSRFPIQCLNRQDLINMLYSGLKDRDDIEIIASAKISDYERRVIKF